jgi:hypothetical protein
LDRVQIVYHIGANCTDGERLLRSLMRNVDPLRKDGVLVPGPGRYRKLLRETILSLGAAQPAPGTRDILLDAIMDEQDARRIILSNSTFLCQPSRVFENGRFYEVARSKLLALRALFPGDGIELFLALRNPATFVPAVWEQVRGMTFRSFLGEMDPRDIRWSDLVATIRATVPEMPLTVWCNEDTTLIWGDVLRRLAGVAPDRPMAGEFDLLATVMTPEGLQRFLSYMESHPGQGQAQERRVIAAFLDKFAIPEAIEEEVDLPGWDAALVDAMTREYEAEVARIAAMPDITFVAP